MGLGGRVYYRSATYGVRAVRWLDLKCGPLEGLALGAAVGAATAAAVYLFPDSRHQLLTHSTSDQLATAFSEVLRMSAMFCLFGMVNKTSNLLIRNARNNAGLPEQGAFYGEKIADLEGQARRAEFWQKYTGSG